jgi:hypothetical protein
MKSDLLIRLRATHMTQCGHGDYRKLPINPDGPEAARLIEVLEAEINQLRNKYEPTDAG